MNINQSQNIEKAKSTPKFSPYLKFKNCDSYPNDNTNNHINTKYIIFDKKIKDKEENKKTNKNSKSFKDSNNVSKDEKKMPKQKSYMENYVLPNDIKKECLLELNKLKEKNGKKLKEKMQLNFGSSITFRENQNTNRKTFENLKKSKKEKFLGVLKKENKENKKYNIGNQKTYYKEFLYGSEKNNHSTNFLNEVFSSENNSKLFPYTKESHG